jgi:hypothetical protein
MPDQEDLYSNDMGGDAGAPAEPKDQKPDAEEDTRGDDQEAILPRTILAGKDFNVGDELVLEVTAIRDNEVSVKYAPAKPEGEGEDEPDSGEGESKAKVPDSMYD